VKTSDNPRINQEELQDLYEEIRSRIQTRTADMPFVIGINGIDASGKTTFAESLSRFLLTKGYSTQLVHVDDFHNEKAIRYCDGDEASNFYRRSFNFERLESLILKPIVEIGHLDTELILLDLESDQYSLKRQYKVSPSTIVIVEGVFLFKRELRHYFDLAIFLHSSFETAMQRARCRDKHIPVNAIEERYTKKYHAGQKLYFALEHPYDKADIIIDTERLYP
jgi:uridine kinase